MAGNEVPASSLRPPRILPWTINLLGFLRVPGPRAKTLEYLAKLRDIPKIWAPDPDVLPFLRDGQAKLAGLVPYPEPPQFPIATTIALVRRIVLISSDGHPMRANLTESVRLRAYRAIHFDLGGEPTLRISSSSG